MLIVRPTRSRPCRRAGFAGAQVLFCAAAILLVSAPAIAQHAPDERVVVTANAYPVAFDSLARSVDVITRDEILRLPVHSLAEILDYRAGVSLRTRAPFGVQTDLSVSGATFQQVLVLVDGVRINDAQTGHHNLDLPFSLADVERIEILHGAGSALHGADAFGGIVNIITRKGGRQLDAAAALGQFGFLEGAARAGVARGNDSFSVSLFGNRSGGFMPDRDFRTAGANVCAAFGQRSELSAAFVDKEFGANGFYGPSPSREWTNQTLISLRRVIAASDGWQASLQSYYRTHGDRFLYDERTPGVFENRHRTHAAGASLLAQRRMSNALGLSFGMEAGGEWIDSTNLGDHAQGRGSGLVEGRITPGRRLVIYPGLRLDYYSNFGSAVSPSLSASWWAAQRIKLRASVGSAFRAPTFTERYYYDPNHQAQADLHPERSWGGEAGVDLYLSKAWIATADAQLRRERNVIDWVRSSPEEKWVTANIRRMTFSGGQLGLERVFDSGRHRLRAGYAYVNGDPGPIDYYSKYVLDYARHSLTAAAAITLPLSLSYSQKVEYRRHADGRAYWVLDGRLSRKFGALALNLDCSNLTDSHYQEVSGVDMPGRWIVLQIAWDVSRH